MSNQKEITKMLLESKVVDFDALGRAVSQLGPQTIFSDDPWENFVVQCVTLYAFSVCRPLVRGYRI